ncbi:hypothetical protein H4219_001861 [Mycoemilia scoparia]|uniref:Flavodoxin-like domain-containing protein n=1 Tax=Mycoemilia scoparia TaxID=417184 RepID=A0A9W8DUU0_9FUNG|nr:hypothetical protein H4219_001861 [Mycoemilia scoparia]
MALPKVYVVFYSMYGHVYKLAQAIQKGLEKSGKVEVKLFQVAETLPQDVLDKMYAAPKPDVPVITPAQLAEADAFLFGIPTRYGTLPAQIKAFWDATGQLWAKGALVGKLAGTFFSTGGQHGGQETTAFTFLTTLVHHGIIYVPLGYRHPNLSDISEVIGGSAYGAGTITDGDGSRQPSQKELDIAEFQGEEFAKTVAQHFSA